MKAAWIGAIGIVLAAAISVIGPTLSGDEKTKLEVSTEELNRILTDRWQQIDEFLGGVDGSSCLDQSERTRMSTLRSTLKSKYELHKAALEQGNSVLAHERFAKLRRMLHEVDELLFLLRKKCADPPASEVVPHREFWQTGIAEYMSYEEGLWSRLLGWITGK